MPLAPRSGSALAEWLSALAEDAELGRSVRHHALLPPAEPDFAPELQLDDALRPLLSARGIVALYRHQARAIEALRNGADVVLATPTASGKSLVYSLPALEACLTNPEARTLLLFPLRALEQDQRKKLETDIATLALPSGVPRPRVAIYDGDTPDGERRKIRADPPNLLITTPDMLHLGLLPHHESWRRFFVGLRLVVVDELHSYRGVFGYRVLRGYTDRDLAALPTFDLLDAIHARLGFRLGLGHLGEETLGVAKSGDGLKALRWWREGRIDQIEAYCRDDVRLVRDLFEHACENGQLIFRTKRGERVRLPLRLSPPELIERAKQGARGAAPPCPASTPSVGIAAP